MLIEVKVKVKRIIDNKTKSRTETYLIDTEFFAQAEMAIVQRLNDEQNSHLLDSYDVISLRQSSIKEIYTQYQGEHSYIISLRDIFTDDNGNEKQVKYKVLLWADSMLQANTRANELQRQGYDMAVDIVKELTNFEYIEEQNGNE